eukprot:CAMPEP_0203857684 /NCGR_PEP_ID=MMETSP0359-20131031/10867_1 /ASSEMBLY_ACC=CAM_ASM_000338 /TAXON_ID=268821 /ORGANISM="Scrippsiella Hangoei, Strain SHTV-5" /LENGTH=108 /DNA_ID=CAMNT_0050774403 /DNA_START=47 /DNA_END=369 /DNA_ORIENTATION=+
MGCGNSKKALVAPVAEEQPPAENGMPILLKQAPEGKAEAESAAEAAAIAAAVAAAEAAEVETAAAAASAIAEAAAAVAEAPVAPVAEEQPPAENGMPILLKQAPEGKA